MFLIANENMHPIAIATLMLFDKGYFPQSYTIAATICAKPYA
jgi:hypothetical protein